MALKPYVIESQQREARQRLYMAAPTLDKFPSIKEVSVELRFVDPDGKNHPSPHKRIFTADMQAFFEFPCPLRDCTGGGYSLSATIIDGLSHRRTEINGHTPCQGRRSREKGTADRCGLELHYQASVRKKDKAAA